MNNIGTYYCNKNYMYNKIKVWLKAENECFFFVIFHSINLLIQSKILFRKIKKKLKNITYLRPIVTWLQQWNMRLDQIYLRNKCKGK